MGERLGPDPLQRALTRFEQTSSGNYNARALQRALDRVRSAGLRVGTSPGELYANLAALSSIAVDLAQKHGPEADQQAFMQQQLGFQQVSEQLKGGEIVLPTSPSQPQRTTGQASG